MLYENVLLAAEEIQKRITCQPKVAIILGSGLGTVAEHLENRTKIPYSEIPGFPASSVAGHAAQLVFGRIGQTEVVAMQGRFHYYEGLSMKQVAFPVFCSAAAWCKKLDCHKRLRRYQWRFCSGRFYADRRSYQSLRYQSLDRAQ